jgi:hypothetical protein
MVNPVAPKPCADCGGELLRSASDTDAADMRFIRYQAAAPNRHGRYPGVFALVNGLAWAGCLTAQQEQFRRRETTGTTTISSIPDVSIPRPTTEAAIRRPKRGSSPRPPI